MSRKFHRGQFIIDTESIECVGHGVKYEARVICFVLLFHKGAEEKRNRESPDMKRTDRKIDPRSKSLKKNSLTWP